MYWKRMGVKSNHLIPIVFSTRTCYEKFHNSQLLTLLEIVYNLDMEQDIY